MPGVTHAGEDLLDALEGLALDPNKAEIENRESRFESERQPTLGFRISSLGNEDGLERIGPDVNAQPNCPAVLLDIRGGLRHRG
jgi:hypothetical protein